MNLQQVLHIDDISRLIKIIDKLVDGGNTVVVIEHNLDVIKCCDHLIDLGPEGGVGGGNNSCRMYSRKIN